MGATTRLSADGLQVAGTGRIRGISADLRDINELAPVLTALAALADAPSEFTGIGHMRLHESDRLAALAGRDRRARRLRHRASGRAAGPAAAAAGRRPGRSTAMTITGW